MNLLSGMNQVNLSENISPTISQKSLKPLALLLGAENMFPELRSPGYLGISFPFTHVFS